MRRRWQVWVALQVAPRTVKNCHPLVWHVAHRQIRHSCNRTGGASWRPPISSAFPGRANFSLTSICIRLRTPEKPGSLAHQYWAQQWRAVISSWAIISYFLFISSSRIDRYSNTGSSGSFLSLEWNSWASIIPLWFPFPVASGGGSTGSLKYRGVSRILISLSW